MSDQFEKATTADTNQKTQDLAHVGALYEQSLGFHPHSGQTAMQRQLVCAHLNAFRGADTGLSAARMRLASAPEEDANLGRQAQAHTENRGISATTRDITPREFKPQDLSHPCSLSQLGNPSMQRWGLETTHDQPWNPFRHESRAASDYHGKK